MCNERIINLKFEDLVKLDNDRWYVFEFQQDVFSSMCFLNPIITFVHVELLLG